jgi:hypothetical protein
MTTKKVDISDDGSTWFTFPGDTGSLQSQATNIKDTVFGQNFESNQAGLISWTLDADGMYKGFAGYVATIKKSGTSTATTNEATTNLATRVYQITNTIKRTFDRSVAVVVKDNGVDQTANVLSIDFMFGIITFKSTYTVVGPVTATYNYLPLAAIAKGQGFTLSQTTSVIDTTDFPTAQSNGGFKTSDYGLRTVALDVNGVFAITNGWLAALTARNELVVEICPDGNQKSIARGLYKVVTEGQSGKVGELEAEQIKFVLSVPDPSAVPLFGAPFSWAHDPTTTLSMSLQKALTAWQNGVPTENFRYLEDGTNGQKGTGVITDLTLTGGLDVMNTFAIKVMGNGGLTVVGTG